MRCGELEKREKQREDKVAELEKALEELKAKYLVLDTEKASVKAEIEQTQGDTLRMLGETFNQVIRQAHLPYKGPHTDGTFDVFKGQLVPIEELVAFQNSTPRTASKMLKTKTIRFSL